MTFNEFYNYIETNAPSSQLFNDLKLINTKSLNKTININEKKLSNLINIYNKYEYPKITCGILTYNEEKNINRCLNSLYYLFDELLVLDSCSTDRTIDILKSYSKVTTFQVPWKNDFSHHRNLIIEKAKFNWIYFIDADNWLNTSDLLIFKKVAKVIEFFKIEGVVSPNIIEHNNHIYTDNRRMFQKNQGIKFYGYVHEEPILKNGNYPNDIPVNIEVYHDGYDENKINLDNKSKRNIHLTKKMIEIEPENPKWLYFYARESY
ncbi:glycosyltransferase, partial [Staphylococcus felis]